MQLHIAPDLLLQKGHQAVHIREPVALVRPDIFEREAPFGRIAIPRLPEPQQKGAVAWPWV